MNWITNKEDRLKKKEVGGGKMNECRLFSREYSTCESYFNENLLPGCITLE
jgi:hypothetical protein